MKAPDLAVVVAAAFTMSGSAQDFRAQFRGRGRIGQVGAKDNERQAFLAKDALPSGARTAYFKDSTARPRTR